jgi:hypothetical protein
MRQPTSSRGQLRLEQLEARCLLAGNVTAAVVNGSLVVTGDAQDNTIEIFQTAQGIQVLGMATTVNGGTSFTAVGVTKDVVVSLGDGSDGLAFDLTVPRDLIIDMGAGDNSVNFGGFFEPPPGDTGPGGVITGRDVVVNAGNGSNFIGIFSSQVGRKTDINLGSGGTSGNFVLVFQSTFSGVTNITSGAGSDFFDIESSTFGAKTLISTGAGDDTLVLANCTFQAQTTLDGGDGFDTLMNTGNTFAVTPVIRGFEA